MRRRTISRGRGGSLDRQKKCKCKKKGGGNYVERTPEVLVMPQGEH